jgi:hypothetical protein
MKIEKKDSPVRTVYACPFEIISFDNDASEYYAIIRADMENRGESSCADDKG